MTSLNFEIGYSDKTKLFQYSIPERLALAYFRSDKKKWTEYRMCVAVAHQVFSGRSGYLSGPWFGVFE